MKKFRILEDRSVVNKFNTLQDCVDWLNKKELGLHSYYVEDLEEDIEVHSDEIIECFNEGETPIDLTFF